jgi:hypothetical protein
MQTLYLKARQLPASRFPERADVYICDRCGRDITRHLHRGRAHVWQPLGLPRYTCLCGQQYPSGAVEWDDLNDKERRSRLAQIVGIGLAMGIPIVGFVFLVRAAWMYHSAILLGLSIAAVVPLAVFVALFTATGIDAVDVVASVLRTRVARLWRR